MTELECDAIPASPTTGWDKQFGAMAELKTGWNGYDADPPNPAALDAARSCVCVFETNDLPLTRVAPSVVGGVGVTRRVGARRVYVEFYNNGTAHALFAEGEDARTEPVPITDAGYKNLAEKARAYLDG